MIEPKIPISIALAEASAPPKSSTLTLLDLVKGFCIPPMPFGVVPGLDLLHPRQFRGPVRPG